MYLQTSAALRLAGGSCFMKYLKKPACMVDKQGNRRIQILASSWSVTDHAAIPETNLTAEKRQIWCSYYEWNIERRRMSRIIDFVDIDEVLEHWATLNFTIDYFVEIDDVN
jgi:hypothetical protein